LVKSSRWLGLIVAIYVALALLYTVVIPLYEASDELWHYPMVQYLATNGLALPPQDPTNPGAWRQEGSQPPLYYLFGAMLTFWIDTSDLNQVRRINPHADIGIAPPDGNVNMMTHSHTLNPLQGTALATYVVRLFSIVLGALTIVVTYHTARQLLPEYPEVALASAGVQACLPMFLFISASVNNDNLSNLLGNLLVLLLIRLASSPQIPTWRDHVLIGMVTGMGILSKLNIGFLIPVVVLVYALISIRLRQWRVFVLGGLISGGLTILIAGWWYWRNYQLYGDPSGLNRFLEMVGARPVRADFAMIWAERDSFTQAFWGFFGGMNVPMPNSIYQVLNIFAVLGFIGTLVFFGNRLYRRDWSLLRWLGVAITLLWIGISMVSYARWTSETIASQGRLIFGALSVIVLWMVWGWVWFLTRAMRQVVLILIVVSFGILAVSQAFWTISPTYRLPDNITLENPITRFREPNNTGEITLTNPQLLTERVKTGEFVQLALDLGIETPMTRNWSLFVHLIDENGVIIAQRDVFPGGGLLATQDLAQGTAWHNPISVFIPKNAYTPLTLDVVIGWYDLQTGERLVRENGETTLSLGQVQLEANIGANGLPNPLNINFGNLVQLVGYEISNLSPSMGDSVALTLYWQALQPISQDYVVFANILDPKTLTKFASSNAMPANWTRPTSTWQLGEIVQDAHTLTIAPNAVAGIYELELGLYIQDEQGKFLRLPVISTNDNFVYLTRVRIQEKTP
jgi:4-amino-4-deoxy-L-arabinose transferase-like glycosyltransferase